MNTLKCKLLVSSVLALQQPYRPYIIGTDVFVHVLGAVLQKKPNNSSLNERLRWATGARRTIR